MNPDTSKDVRALQFWNILDIFVTFVVLNPLTSKDVRAMHPLNILDIFVTFEVSIFLKSIDDRFLQFLKVILLIFLLIEGKDTLLKPLPLISISRSKREFIILSVPDIPVHPLRLILFKYVCGSKLPPFEFISLNKVHPDASNSINLVAAPINNCDGLVVDIPFILFILLPPYINTSWSVAACAVPVKVTDILPSIFFLSICPLYQDKC